jgi:hypothetical protein
MATTTDFSIFLEEADPDGFEEVYALYQAVKNEEEYGLYECTKNSDGKLFIKANHTSSTLLIASEKAKKLFLDTIEKKFCEDMDIESWYGLHNGLSNPHA